MSQPLYQVGQRVRVTPPESMRREPFNSDVSEIRTTPFTNIFFYIVKGSISVWPEFTLKRNCTPGTKSFAELMKELTETA